MIIGTDDAAWRDLVFVWKGPADNPMPWEARYQAWLGALVLTPLFAVVIGLLLFPMDLLPWHFLVALVVRIVVSLTLGATLAILLVRRFGQVVTTTRPLAHHLAVLMAEAGAPRRRAGQTRIIAARPRTDRTRTVTVGKRGNP